MAQSSFCHQGLIENNSDLGAGGPLFHHRSLGGVLAEAEGLAHRMHQVGVGMDTSIAILVALVRLGGLATIEAGPGAIFFAAVVVSTMFAAMSFDPRLIWDSMETNYE